MSAQNFRTLALAKEFYKECERVPCKLYVRDQLARAALRSCRTKPSCSSATTISARGSTICAGTP